ncbi:MAG: Stf0 family sulfotransferase, partial [Sphingomicrobium sp.]
AQWRSDLQRRTSPNGVFGIKCFPTQMRELHQRNPELFGQVMAATLPSSREAFAIRLRRRDRAAHAISYARAALSGVWRKEQEGEEGVRVEFSAKAVEHARTLLDQEDAMWNQLFGSAGLQPLTLWYEEILEQPAEAVLAVARFLRVELDPSAAIAVPNVHKQAEEDPRLWAQLYAAETSA